MFDLEGRVGDGDGCAQGIGKAIALNLADGGADIVVANIQVPTLDAAIKEIEDKGRRVLKFCLDVTDARGDPGR